MPEAVRSLPPYTRKPTPLPSMDQGSRNPEFAVQNPKPKPEIVCPTIIFRIGFGILNPTPSCPRRFPPYPRNPKPCPYRGTSLIRNNPPPSDHHRALGLVLLWGPRGGAIAYERGTPAGGTLPTPSDLVRFVLARVYYPQRLLESVAEHNVHRSHRDPLMPEVVSSLPPIPETQNPKSKNRNPKPRNIKPTIGFRIVNPTHRARRVFFPTPEIRNPPLCL